MSSASQSPWQRLIDEHKLAFAHLGHPISPHVNSETALRSHFEALCRRHGDKYPARALFKLQNHGIDAFTGALDTALDHKPPDTLAGLAYGGIYAVTMSGCGAGLRLTDVVEALGRLNRAVPRLGTEIPRFPHNSTVQRPLQDIFSAYINALESLAGYFSSHSSDPHRLRPQNAIDYERFSSLCDEKRAVFETALRRAEAEMNNRAYSTGRRHYSNSMMDTDRHPYDTHARFKTLRRLGHGSFGHVDEVEEITTGIVYARKNILLGRDPATKERRLELIEKEFRIMEKLTHDHIITVLFWLRSDDVCSIFMKQACEMDLRYYLEDCTQRRFPHEDLRQMLQWSGCLLKALASAHRRNIIHKDIKPSNILIKEGQVYLADFGMAKEDIAGEQEVIASFSQWGSATYRAPEVTPGHPSARGPKADVFSLGCVFSEMLTVCAKRSLADYRMQRCTGIADEGELVPFRSTLPQIGAWLDSLRGQCINSAIADILLWQTSSMLNQDPERRPSARNGVQFLDGQRERDRDMLFCDFC